MSKKVLVTGAIGFMGYHLVKKLLAESYSVVGIDNINSYYDVRLKYAKLPILGIDEDFIWPNVPYQSKKNTQIYNLNMDHGFSFKDINEREHLIKLKTKLN